MSSEVDWLYKHRIENYVLRLTHYHTNARTWCCRCPIIVATGSARPIEYNALNVTLCLRALQNRIAKWKETYLSPETGDSIRGETHHQSSLSHQVSTFLLKPVLLIELQAAYALSLLEKHQPLCNLGLFIAEHGLHRERHEIPCFPVIASN